MVEAAKAEDTEAAIRMVTDEDDTNCSDSDYNSVDAERDAQEEKEDDEDDDDEEDDGMPKAKPKLKVVCPLLRVVSLLSRLYRYEMGRPPRKVPQRLGTRQRKVHR
jgi:hypothetical protein